jgi:Uma2 family endonuclease
MPALAHPLATVEEYFALEQASQDKHEFYHGRITAMAGGSLNHSVISGNAITELNLALRATGGKCLVLNSDMRLAVKVGAHYTYADAVVVCGKPAYHPKRRDTITNPVLIVEVPSPSTERVDRGRKSVDYRKVPSLQEYLLLSQFEPRAELYRRQPDGSWQVQDWNGLEAVVELESAGIPLRLAEVYRNVEFETEEG